uniref:Uncharacterized protein n=1 Tax=Triticum aestivum TaxID=4565 RepID=A0A077RWQ4_WHEAT|nr:unnamed protein product [Triticum aestivum]
MWLPWVKTRSSSPTSASTCSSTALAAASPRLSFNSPSLKDLQALLRSDPAAPSPSPPQPPHTAPCSPSAARVFHRKLRKDCPVNCRLPPSTPAARTLLPASPCHARRRPCLALTTSVMGSSGSCPRELLYVVVGAAIAWCAVRALEWEWWRPQRLDRGLRSQGLRGMPYRSVAGDAPLAERLIEEARSRSMPLGSPAPRSLAGATPVSAVKFRMRRCCDRSALLCYAVALGVREAVGEVRPGLEGFRGSGGARRSRDCSCPACPAAAVVVGLVVAWPGRGRDLPEPAALE